MPGIQKAPFVVEVKAGEKAVLCACGMSKLEGRCDGAHKGTGKKPHVETFTEDKSLYICGCGESKNSPYCDGTHQSL